MPCSPSGQLLFPCYYRIAGLGWGSRGEVEKLILRSMQRKALWQHESELSASSIRTPLGWCAVLATYSSSPQKAKSCVRLTPEIVTQAKYNEYKSTRNQSTIEVRKSRHQSTTEVRNPAGNTRCNRSQNVRRYTRYTTQGNKVKTNPGSTVALNVPHQFSL